MGSQNNRQDGTGETPPLSPWKTYGEREVYRNPWLHVVEYSVQRPDGKPGIYGVVYPGDNAAVVALDEQNRVCLVGEFVYPLQRFEWMIPSGKVEESEDPLRCAQRELAEETGLEASRWESLGDYYLSSGISPQTSYIFLASDVRYGVPQPEGTELLQIEWRPLSIVVDSCLRGEIRDAPTVLGILRARMLRA